MRARVLTMLLVVALILVGGVPSLAADGDQALGEKLVRGFWQAVQAKDWKKVEKALPPGMQYVNQAGALDRKGYLAQLKGLEMGQVSFRDFKVTRQGRVLMVSYRMAVDETIGGQRLTGDQSAPRLTVFVKGRTWRLVAHANPRPLAK